MANDIKINNLGLIYKGDVLPKSTPKTAAHYEQRDVAVSPQLDHLVGLLHVEDDSIRENERAMAAKSQIDSGNYQVNYDALAHKLLNGGFINMEH